MTNTTGLSNWLGKGAKAPRREIKTQRLADANNLIIREAGMIFFNGEMLPRFLFITRGILLGRPLKIAGNILANCSLLRLSAVY